MKVYRFQVEFSGDRAAGLYSFSEEVVVIVGRDAGGEDHEFPDFMRDALKEWFDGAGVWQLV